LINRGLRRGIDEFGFGENANEARFNLPVKLGGIGSELGRRFTSSSLSSSSTAGSIVKLFNKVWGKILFLQGTAMPVQRYHGPDLTPGTG
jgi:hypothetical protein